MVGLKLIYVSKRVTYSQRQEFGIKNLPDTLELLASTSTAMMPYPLAKDNTIWAMQPTVSGAGMTLYGWMCFAILKGPCILSNLSVKKYVTDFFRELSIRFWEISIYTGTFFYVCPVINVS